ncbi:hypothetical protein HDE_05680 [Halotydeus destructor]|nr:hypothetical protein HDE_05680 [Halotydeus destructor]
MDMSDKYKLKDPKRNRTRAINIPGAEPKDEDYYRWHESVTDDLARDERQQTDRNSRRQIRADIGAGSHMDPGMLAASAPMGSPGQVFEVDEEIAKMHTPSGSPGSPDIFRPNRPSPPPERPDRDEGAEIGLAGISHGKGHYYQVTIPAKVITYNGQDFDVPAIPLEIFVPWVDDYEPDYYFKETRRWKAWYNNSNRQKEKFGGIGPLTRWFRFCPPIQPGQRYEHLSPDVSAPGVHAKFAGLSRRIQNFDRRVHMADIDKDWFDELEAPPIPRTRIHRAPSQPSASRMVLGAGQGPSQASAAQGSAYSRSRVAQFRKSLKDENRVRRTGSMDRASGPQRGRNPLRRSQSMGHLTRPIPPAHGPDYGLLGRPTETQFPFDEEFEPTHPYGQSPPLANQPRTHPRDEPQRSSPVNIPWDNQRHWQDNYLARRALSPDAPFVARPYESGPSLRRPPSPQRAPRGPLQASGSSYSSPSGIWFGKHSGQGGGQASGRGSRRTSGQSSLQTGGQPSGGSSSSQDGGWLGKPIARQHPGGNQDDQFSSDSSGGK